MFFVRGANQYSKVLEMRGGQTGMRPWWACQHANLWFKGPYCCWHELKGHHCILGPGFNKVLSCILTTCSTSREISHVMIISIVLWDYSDHCQKSLNCNRTQQSSAAGKKPIQYHRLKFTCCLLYNLEICHVFVFICLSFSVHADVHSK